MPADVSLTGIEFEIRGSANSASNSIKSLTKNIDKLNASFARSKSIGSLSSQIRQIGDSAKAASKHTSNFASSILRIAKYRMIRGAIKAVTSAFQEGLKNAYQFSKINGGGLAASLDLIATKSLTMKNQLGAAFGALINAIAPIVVQLINLITRLANALSMLFSALGGQSQYKKAVDVWTEWGEAAGGAGAAAKEALKYLAPFDELNRLPDENQGGGGGGGSTPDFSEMFEYVDLPEWLQNFADKMNELASSLKITFNDVFFDWSDLTGEQIAEKAIVGLGALLGAGVGFMIGGVPGAIVGTLLGATIGLLISAMTFDHDGVISRAELGTMVSVALSALCGGIIGFTVGGPGGALIGAAIGMGVSGALKAAEFFSDGAVGNVVQQFATALTILTGAVIGFTVGGPAGALIGAAIGIGVSAAITGVEFATTGGSFWQGIDYFATEVLGLPTNAEWQAWGEGVWQKISEGLSAGWHWITDGFQDFGEELYNIFIQPIVDAFRNFSLKDIILGSGDGSGSGSSENSGWLSDIFGGGIQTEVEVTGVKDSIPSDDKKLSGFQSIVQNVEDKIDLAKKKISGFFANITNQGYADLPLEKRKINEQANIISQGYGDLSADKRVINEKADIYAQTFANLPADKRIINEKADIYAQTFANLPADKRIINEKADIYAQTFENLPSNKRMINETANIYAQDYTGLPSDKRIINEKANIYSQIDSLSSSQRTLTTYGEFTQGWWASWLGWGDKTLEARAEMKHPYWSDGTPTMTVYAAMTPINNPGYVMGGYAKGGAYYGGAWHDIPQAAKGGQFHGTLFWAGEKGAEVVGHAGGRTEVLNRSQLASTMYAAVRSAMSGIAFNVSSPSMGTSATDDGANEDMLYRAFLRALNDSDFDDRPIELDGAVVYNKMVQRNRIEKRRTGINPMLAS